MWGSRFIWNQSRVEKNQWKQGAENRVAKHRSTKFSEGDKNQNASKLKIIFRL